MAVGLHVEEPVEWAVLAQDSAELADVHVLRLDAPGLRRALAPFYEAFPDL